MISYSDSFIEFLKSSRNKIAKTLYRSHLSNYASYRLMFTTSEINYLALRPDGNISYLPSGRELKFDDSNRWSVDGMQDGKPARVIRRLFTKKALALFKDKDFENFANAYKSKTFDSLKFEIRSNEEIPSIYNMELAGGDGSLNNSCMNRRGYFMDIYKNCDKLRILIMLDKDGLLCGRALIWNLEDDITLLDRIYVVEDYMYELFLSYASERGWWQKRNYHSPDPKNVFINSKGEEVKRNFRISTQTTFKEYPYIDTFTYGDDGSLNNYHDGYYEYEFTEGSRGGAGWDQIYSRTINRGDQVTVTHGRHIDHTTHFSNVVNIGSEVWWFEDPNIVKIDGIDYHVEDTVQCRHDGVRRLKSECIWSDARHSYILKSEFLEMEKQFSHSEAAIEALRA